MEEDHSSEKKDKIHVTVKIPGDCFTFTDEIPSNLSDKNATTFGLGMVLESGLCGPGMEVEIKRNDRVIFEKVFFVEEQETSS